MTFSIQIFEFRRYISKSFLLNRFAKFTMARELASSEMGIPTRGTFNTDSSTEKGNSAGLMELSTEVNSRAMKLPEKDVTNGLMVQLTKVRSKTV